MKRLLKFLLKTALVLFIALNIMAAFHAYKFTHFYDESALERKRPEDFTTWDKTSAILFGIKYPKLKNVVSPDTVYQTIQIKTDDNLNLEGWYLTHPSLKKGTVILFHGHGGNKSGVLHEGYAFFNMGYNVLLVDFRAHGGSEGNVCTVGYNESYDVKAAYDFIKSKGENNIVLHGISLGAASIMHAVDRFELQPSKLILEMPFGSLLQAVKGRVRIMGLPEQPVSSLLTFWGGIEQGFWAFNLNPSEYAKKINCPVLLQWGINDNRVTKKEIDNVYANISSAKKLVVYNNSGHQSLCKNEWEKWRNEVSGFLKP